MTGFSSRTSLWNSSGTSSSSARPVTKARRDLVRNSASEMVGASRAWARSRAARSAAGSGAAAKAQRVAARHNGDPEATRNDPEYLKCQAACNDFSSTLQEKQARALELEADLEELIDNVGRHKAQIQTQMRELEKLGEGVYGKVCFGSSH